MTSIWKGKKRKKLPALSDYCHYRERTRDETGFVCWSVEPVGMWKRMATTKNQPGCPCERRKVRKLILPVSKLIIVEKRDKKKTWVRARLNTRKYLSFFNSTSFIHSKWRPKVAQRRGFLIRCLLQCIRDIIAFASKFYTLFTHSLAA